MVVNVTLQVDKTMLIIIYLLLPGVTGMLHFVLHFVLDLLLY